MDRGVNCHLVSMLCFLRNRQKHWYLVCCTHFGARCDLFRSNEMLAELSHQQSSLSELSHGLNYLGLSLIHAQHILGPFALKVEPQTTKPGGCPQYFLNHCYYVSPVAGDILFQSVSSPLYTFYVERRIGWQVQIRCALSYAIRLTVQHIWTCRHTTASDGVKSINPAF